MTVTGGKGNTKKKSRREEIPNCIALPTYHAANNGFK